ncbi:MAG: DNA adenine methylase [Hydrotalea sp.]|nr:DNA adenine methylase [Hydrotalea sp.]
MNYHSPLRYPGGKAKLTDFVKDIYQHNKLSAGTYVEPYAGGAAVALSLLFDGYVKKIIINDLDIAVFSFWQATVKQTEELSKKIRDTKISVREWKKQKNIYNHKEGFDQLDIAFSFFFLNRVNHSGVLNGGIIGGKRQAGDLKMDARFNKKDLIKRIERIADCRKKIEIKNDDALHLIKKIKNKKNSFIYMDPPYYEKGKKLYKNFYQHDDHVEIAAAVADITSPMIITYDNVAPIKEIYRDQNQSEIALNYSLNNTRKRSATEILIYKNITLP